MIEQLFSAGMWAAAATMVTTALTATGRPGTTVFVLLAVPTALLESGLWEAHHWFFPPTHMGVLLLFGLWALIENVFRGEFYGELMQALPLDQLAALLFIWLMFVGKVALGTASDVPDVADEMRKVIPVGPGLVLLGITVPLNLGFGWARNRVVEVLRDLGFGGTAAVVEFVGVVGGVVGVMFLPALALGAAVFAAVPIVTVAVTVRVGAQVVDRQRRRPCPYCQHPARQEASRCPRCHAPLQIVRALAPPRTR